MSRHGKFPRNHYAVAAHFRNSAGPIRDEKHERNRTACRRFSKRTALEQILLEENLMEEDVTESINLQGQESVQESIQEITDFWMSEAVECRHLEE